MDKSQKHNKEVVKLKTDSLEDIILKYSSRGMNVLRGYLSENYCTEAAKEILSWKRGNVLIATGFYVAGYAETDGPAGAYVMYYALKKIGFSPIIITDKFCKGFFEEKGMEVKYLDLEAGEESCKAILRETDPVGMISIERCGKNIDGKYANMRGVDIGGSTAPIDELFRIAKGKVPTIGIGDGGNEIGMGNLADVISEKLELVPCKVKTDILVIASVSNWGAYGLAEALGELTENSLLASAEEVEDYIKMTVDKGSVDGVTHQHIVSVDGNDFSIEKEIINELLSRQN